MRSVLFFLVVFSTLLGVLYFFVEKDPFPRPPVEFGDDLERAQFESSANTVELPFYNTKKGRREYVLRGELDDALIQDIQDIRDFGGGVLYNGEIEIPIYEDMAKDLPKSSDARPSVFRLTFRRAEYRLEQDEAGKQRQIIRLLDGGEGLSDDGTVIRFDEMTVRIEEVLRKKVFLISSGKPVSITNDMITIESPSGMEGRFQEDRKLETVLFHPPVNAFVSAESAKFFSLEDSAEKDAKNDTGDSRGEDGDTQAAGLVAVTCQGPLHFDRAPDTPEGEASERQTILFEKDVRIFQLDKRTPGVQPEPTDTWFHCQRFEIFIDRAAEDDAQPSIREAVATWPGGRVLSAHRTLRANGEKLTWNQSEARLVGRPIFQDEHFRMSCNEAVFKLSEDLVVLDGDVTGDFALEFGESAADAEKQRKVGEDSAGASSETDEAEPKDPPARMEFQTNHAEIYFKEGSKAGARVGKVSGEERTARDKADEALSSVRRFVARSDEDDGLVLRSADGAFLLRGRRFTYDSESRKVTLEGGLAKRPYFEHGKSRGEARVIDLLLDEQRLRLVEEVDVQLQVRAKERAVPVPASDPPAPASSEESSPLVRVLADVMDVAMDLDARALLWAEARGEDGRFVSLSPVGDSAATIPYRVEGPVLHWDHAQELATLASPGDGPATYPRIEFESGRLRAREIRFERKTWTATLREGVEIESVQSEIGPTTTDEPIRFTCDRAEAEFYEGLEPRGDDPEQRLRSVRRLHAWRSETSPMVIEGPDFSASGHEAVWNAEVRELKLFGEGQQEFRRREGKREDVLRADEITFLRAENRLELRRNVTGRIRQPESRSDGGLKIDGAASRALEWKFATDILDVYLRDGALGADMTIEKLQAFQRVQLVCEQKGIQLHGDDLLYTADLQQLRIFSSDDRFQTLKRVREYVTESGQIQPLTDEIHAREIRLNYFRDERVPGDDREHGTQVKVQFRDDVTAAFHNIAGSSRFAKRERRESGSRDSVQVWKFRSDFLALELVPRMVGRGEIQSAYSVGNVDISCADADVSAKSQEAQYSEAHRRLILRGDVENKVYLKHGDGVYNKAYELEIREIGTKNIEVNVLRKRPGR